MENHTGRRQFLGVGAGVLVVKPGTAFGSAANSALEIGLIGCGGRGNWVGSMFQEFTGARIVALHDPFADRLEEARTKLRCESARLCRGLDGYKELVASKLDAVVIESPPYYRPEQAAAAVAAGKHVYMAKPVAVDVAGCESIVESSRKTGGKRSFFTDFQFRAKPVFQECVQRVRRGDIGSPVVGHVYYHSGRLPRKDKPGMTADQARLLNWVFDKRLSGDIIVEQNIHCLDAACWLLDAAPIRAYGTGGRKARIDVGDCWDHFLVTYWFPDGVKVDFSSTQCIKGYGDICARIYASEGTAEMHYGGVCSITGEKPWPGATQDDTGRQGTIDNIRQFVASVQSGRPINNTAETVRSNLTAILGRMAAYKETMVTWDEMMRSREKIEASLGPLG